MSVLKNRKWPSITDEAVGAGLVLTGAMVIAGSSVVVAEIIVADFPIFLANELRFLIASLLLVPLLITRNGGLPRFTRHDSLVLVAQALTGVFLFNICLFYGVRLTSAAQAGVITGTTPVFVGVLAVLFLNERLTKNTAAGIGFVVLGIVVIQLFGSVTGSEPGSHPLIGNTLILGAVLGEALFTVLGKAVTDRVTPLEITTSVSVLGSILFLPFAAYEALSFDLSTIGLVDWVPIVYYGVVVTVIAFVLWFRGVSMVPASTAAAFTSVFPVSAVLLSYLLLGEPFSWFHIIGIVCVVAGIGFTARERIIGESEEQLDRLKPYTDEKRMGYRPSNSVIEYRLMHYFPAERLRELPRQTGLVERQRKLDAAALFWALTLGFAVDVDQSIEALRQSYLQCVGGDFSLTYASFHGWFAASLTTFLRGVLDHALDDPSQSTDRFDGRLARFRDVLVPDMTAVTLYRFLIETFPGYGDEHAGAKLHVVESVATGLPTQFSITDARTHESTQLSTGQWLSGSLLLYDQGFFDYRTMDLIDANDGWFVTRLKPNANPLIVEELREWRGNAISLSDRQLRNVVDDLHRDVIDVHAEVSFRRRSYNGSRSGATRTFRVVGVWNEETKKYHLYVTNLPVADYSPSDIAQLYRLGGRSNSCSRN